MAFTQADVDALQAAIAAGGHIQSMTVGGQQFTFRSVEDMQKLLSMMQSQISGGKKNHRLAATSKGA